MNEPDENETPGNEENEEVAASASAESADPEPAEEEAPGLRQMLLRLRSRRVLMAAGSAFVFMALLGGLLVWVFSPSMESARPKKRAASALHQAAEKDTPARLVKQDFEPFYIPLPKGESGGMARVTLSVTWDRSSSSRFQDQAVLARDRLYRRMSELAAGGGNMRAMSPAMRSEAQKILEELFHPDELHVVITGVFIV